MERDVDQRLMEAEEMAEMGIRCTTCHTCHLWSDQEHHTASQRLLTARSDSGTKARQIIDTSKIHCAAAAWLRSAPTWIRCILPASLQARKGLSGF